MKNSFILHKLRLLMFRLLGEHTFLRSVAIISGGTALGQLIAIAASPVITRLYSPADFGSLALFVSILAPALSLVAMRYEVAIILPTEDDIAVSIVWLSLFITLVTTLIFAGLIFFIDRTSIDRLGFSSLGRYAWLIPISFLGGGVYLVMSYWAIRKQNFGALARTRVIQQGWMVFVQIALGSTVSGPLGLFVGDVVGRSAGSLKIIRTLSSTSEHLKKRPSLGNLLDVAKRYRRFPILSSGPAVLDSLALQLPILLLANQYGPEAVGFFALGQRMLATPLSLVGNAVSQVLLGRAATFAAEDLSNLNRLFRLTVKKLLVLGTIAVLPVALTAPWIFGFFFGARWSEAGVYVQLLAPLLLCQFVVSPIGGILDVLERQDLHMYREVIRTVLVFVAGIGGAFLNQGPRMTVSLLSGGGVLGYLIGLVLTHSAIRVAMQMNDPRHFTQRDDCHDA